MIKVTSTFMFDESSYIDAMTESGVNIDDPEAVIEWYEQFGDLNDHETERTYEDLG